MFKFLRLSFVTCLLVTIGALTAFAQSTVTGGIGGLVTDPNGAVLTNATVTARNTETNQETTATSDSDGRYRVINLTPGTYLLTINSQGFGGFSAEKVIVEVGRITEIDAQLKLGGNKIETVVATSETPVINTDDQDFSTNINQVTLNNIPSNGRRWSNMAILTPGTSPDGTFGLISFRGISGLLNNNTIDGGDNNQAFFSEERGRTRIGYVVSQDSIREFQVNTSNYSAEYGRSAGGVVNAVTKSGTNEFHGTGFLFDRNNKLGTRNPRSTINQLVNGVSTPVAFKAPDVRYQFGGSLGGPIVKDKLFFFFSFDDQRRNFPGVAMFANPSYLTTTNTCVSATAPGCTLNLFNASLKNPKTNLSDAQINSGLSFLNSLTGATPRRGDQTLYFPKIDWNINSKNTLTGDYNRLRWASPAGVQTASTVTRDRAGFGDDFVQADTLNIRLASTLSSRLVNEARFEASRELDSEFADPGLPGEPTTANGFSPQVALTNGLTFGKSTGLDRRALPDERRLQIADTISLSYGRHSIKWGADFNHVHEIYDELFTEAGSYAYANINDFLIDYTNFTSNGALRAANVICSTSTRAAGKCYTSNYQQGFGPARFVFNTKDYAFFLQDDWHVTPRLTANLGLRYEYENIPKMFPALINPALPQTANQPSDNNNFGPRVGFAYRLTNDGRTSLRGGYGIYYGRVNGSAIIQALINTDVPGQSQIVSSVAATAAGSPIFPNILPSAPAGTATVNYFGRNFQNPQIFQGDFVFEREVSRNMVVSVSYLNSYGKYLPNFVDTNISPTTVQRSINIVDGPFAGQVWTFPFYVGTRPNLAFGQIQEIRSDVSSHYNALVVQANRRLTKGLQFQTSYTLSKSTDDGQNSQTFTPGFSAPLDPLNQAGETGYSAFDRRHKFVASVVYNTNFESLKDNKVGRAIFNGWTIAPVVQIYSGFRYTGTASGSNVNAVFGTPQISGSVNGSNGSLRFGLVPNNFFKAPAINYTDMRISRRFAITEKTNIELIAEGFNIFNHTEVTSVNTTLYTISTTPSPNPTSVIATFNPQFGTTTGASGFFFGERQIQLGIRFQF